MKIPTPYLSAHPTGSRYITSPATLDTDDDWLVLVEDLIDAASDLEQAGLTSSLGSVDPVQIEGPWKFISYRDGEKNYVLTADRTMYLRSVAATLLAKQLNLTDKDERISLFRTVKFGESEERPLGLDPEVRYTGRLP